MWAIKTNECDWERYMRNSIWFNAECRVPSSGQRSFNHYGIDSIQDVWDVDWAYGIIFWI